jgi:TfoX/Sxy family transcriptional regulator of competence genes
MVYDERLADRVRRALGARDGIAEKKMFGGVAFLHRGKMFVGVTNDDLMVRVGPELHERALAEAHVRPMDFTGRPMKGYVFVGRDGCRTVKAVEKWVERGSSFVATLAPAGSAAAPRRRATPSGATRGATKPAAAGRPARAATTEPRPAKPKRAVRGG